MVQKRPPKGPKRSASKKTNSPQPASTPEAGPTAGTQVAFRLRGAKAAYESPLLLKTTEVKLNIKAELSSGSVLTDRPQETVSVVHDDIIEIEFENGERLWLRADDYFERFVAPAARGVFEGEVLNVSPRLDLLFGGMQARGPISWVVKSVKVLGVDLPEKAALTLARAVEKRVPEDVEARKKRPGPGIYRCSSVTGVFFLSPAKLSALLAMCGVGAIPGSFATKVL